MEVLFDGIPLDKVSTSMTINGPAIILWAFYIAAAEKQGVPADEAAGHDPERHPEGVHGAARLVLPDRARAAPDRRLLRVGRDARAAVEHDLHLRLPHPRGRLDRRAGARVHARRRLHVRRARHRARAGRRRLRAAPVVLLGHPQRLLRGDREAARGAPHLGAPHEGAVRRQEPQLVDDALPLADGGRDAHRAAADEQRRARRLPGARRGARRHAVAAHQLDGRDARAADRSRRCRSRCARSRCSPTRPACRTSSIRWAARTTSRRSPTSSSARPRRCSTRSTSIGGVVRGLEDGWFQRKIARVRRAAAVGDRAASPRHRRRERVRHRRGGARRSRCSRSARRPSASSATRMAKMRAERDQRARATQRSSACATAARGTENVVPAHPRLRARVLHAVRDPRARWRTCSAPTASRCSSESGEEEGGMVGVILRCALPARVRADLRPDARPPRGRASDRAARPCRPARASSTCPCGQGRHAHLLAEAGFRRRWAGLLGAPARPSRGSAARVATLRYTRGDMRKLPARWTGRFDAVVNLFTSFGFFAAPADDARVIVGVRARARARRGARLAWRQPRRRDGQVPDRATGGSRTTGR